MTDSVITDACQPAETAQPADTSRVPMPPSYDDTRPRGEFDGNSHTTDVVTSNEQPTVVKTNGHADDGDTDAAAAENLQSAAVSASCGGPKNIDAETSCTKLSSSDLRTNGCGGQNLGNSATEPLLTNGHIDM